MNPVLRRPRLPQIVGLILLLVGTLDPLEGSVLIVAGTAVAAVGAWVHRGRRRALQAWACALTVVGVASLFGLSAVGGLGGESGLPWAWGILLLPYPVGWALGLAGMILALRRPRAGEGDPGQGPAGPSAARC